MPHASFEHRSPGNEGNISTTREHIGLFICMRFGFYNTTKTKELGHFLLPTLAQLRDWPVRHRSIPSPTQSIEVSWLRSSTWSFFLYDQGTFATAQVRLDPACHPPRTPIEWNSRRRPARSCGLPDTGEAQVFWTILAPCRSSIAWSAIRFCKLMFVMCYLCRFHC